MNSTTLQQYPRIEALLSQYRKAYATESTQRIRQREDVLLERVKATIQQLDSLRIPVCQEAVCQAMKISLNTLRSYPCVKALLTELAENRRAEQQRRRQQREEHLLEQVQGAINRLKECGTPVTQSAVSNIVGASISDLRYYPPVKALLAQATADRHTEQRLLKQQREEYLLEAVHRAADQLKVTGRAVTQESLCEFIGVPTHLLHTYPKVDSCDFHRLLGKE